MRGAASHRTQRVGQHLARHLSRLIQYELNDPRVGLITITEVKVTLDLAYAKVYFTLLEDKQHNLADCTQALNKAAGYLRRLLAQAVEMRSIPALQFIYDESFERHQRISSLVSEALSKHPPAQDDNPL